MEYKIKIVIIIIHSCYGYCLPIFVFKLCLESPLENSNVEIKIIILIFWDRAARRMYLFKP